jgi:TonB-dependent receptor
MLKAIHNISRNFLFMRSIFIISFILIQSQLMAQNTGSISGKIVDKNTNEELIGANVLIVGTTTGASTDIDGKYVINGLVEGNYTVKISYISYQTITVEKVHVKTGSNTKIDVALESASTELQEVIVTAEALKNSEASVLKILQKSDGISDGVSAELISKNNSSDGSDILKRMTGVTIAEGKYSYIRGVSDRYNNTLLNGASLPSTDPEKKSFSYDIFPASLIENIITAKTFTPDKPADFSGGLVQISTIEFPSKFTLNVSTSADYRTNTTGSSFATYSGGSKDFLAFDDGSRSIPSIISDTKVARGNFSLAEINEIGKSFKNNWNTSLSNAPINGNLKITLGDNYKFGDDILGYIASFSYTNSFENKEVEKAAYTFDDERYNYSGNNYSSNVMLSGLLNVSYKFSGTNKISIKNIYNQNADDEVTVYEGFYRYADQYRKNTSIRYISRSLFSTQLIGEHNFSVFNSLGIDWHLNYANSNRNEPDARRYIYSRQIDDPDAPLRFQLDQSLATRYYGNLDDNNFGAAANFTIKLFDNPELPTIKLGYAYDRKNRDFDARLFGFRNNAGGSFIAEDSILQRPVQEIFKSENFSNTFIETVEITKVSDSYDAKQSISAGYLMFDTRILEKIRLVAGARFENSKQILNAFADAGNDADVNRTYNDVLPSVNLTYSPIESINFRAGFSKTLARPEFRELASFTYFDFVANEIVQGNPELTRSLINNYDFRFESFAGAGELYAVGLFYKDFKNPIEQILVASSAFEPSRSYRNANSATTYGIELELRKSLGFFSNWFNDFSFVGNVALMKSNIQFEETNNTRGETFQETERPLQGQAEYILNFGLYYDDFESGLNTSVVYNKVGQQISKVGFNGLGNVIEMPKDLLDFSISKKMFSVLSLKLTIKDILNQDKRYIQQAPGGDKPYEINRIGRSFSLGISYQIF